jgi:TolB-like protein/tetratricopeptide (TPR) repeat protein
MTIWSAEIKDLDKLFDSFKGQHPKLDKELEKLIKTDDENMVLIYARRCIEVIITDLCERELKRPRGTEPLKGIIDKLNREGKVPENIITAMHSLNSMSTFGAHPKDFDPRQVKPVILDLTTVVDWYLKYAESREKGTAIQGMTTEGRTVSPHTGKKSRKSKLILVSGILLACVAVFIALIFLDVIGGGKKAEARPIESLAILPFNNYTGDDNLDYFVSGMHSALIGDVGHISGLRVISETSAKAYKNVGMPISDIATELKVEGVIEASVLCLGDSICIQLRLINAADNEEVLWTGNYKEEKSQILNLYNKVTRHIADEVKVKLTPHEETLLAESKNVNEKAYDAYLKGQIFWDRLGEDDLNTAMEYFKVASQEDPEWAPPYAGIAKVWGGKMQMGFVSPDIAIPKIYENLNKAEELDPNFADSYFMNAVNAVWIEWNWENGEEEFLTALKLNPNDVLSRIYYAHLLMILERLDEAVVQGKLAVDADPLNPLVLALYSVVLIDAGNFKSAVDYAEKAVSIDPTHYFANNALDYASYYNGDSTRAIEAMTTYIAWTDDETLSAIKQTFQDKGYTAALKRTTAEQEEAAQKGYVLPFDVLFNYLRIKKYDEAMKWLESGYDIHDPNMPYIGTFLCSFDNQFKNDPRYIAIIKKMNLPLPID